MDEDYFSQTEMSDFRRQRKWRISHFARARCYGWDGSFKKYGIPQGPTGIKDLQPFSRPSQDVGTFRAVATQVQDVGPSAPKEVQIMCKVKLVLRRQ